MARALIGHTGLVGGNLQEQWSFDRCYNSRNIGEIDGHEFDLLVCAGVSGYKWLVNREPEADRRRIENLLGHLNTVACRRLIWIYTIDIYPQSDAACDEGLFPPQPPAHPYGLLRWELENRIKERFPHAVIVRLPGIYGRNLKKNPVFDLLHHNYLEHTHPDSRYQWYWLRGLGRDLETILSAGAPCVNLFTEPLSMREVVQTVFSDCYDIDGEGLTVKAGGRFVPRSPECLMRRYDLRSTFGTLFGQPAGFPYVQSKEQVLSDLADYRRRHEMQQAGEAS